MGLGQRLTALGERPQSHPEREDASWRTTLVGNEQP